MAAELKVNDASTWRNVVQVQVNDSGVWRTIQDIKVNDSGTWRTVFQYLLLEATITEGQGGTGNQYYGYSDPSIFNFGSITSAAVAGGYTLREITSEDITPGGTTRIIVDGFGADPGQSFFTSITVAGTPLTSASAVYSYVSGTATWTWTSFVLDGVGTSTLVINP